MLISLNWLSDFININKSPKEIADKITLSLSEVEQIKKVGEDTILEIENKALTHRPDCFSQLGLAREIAAFFNLKVFDPLSKLMQTKVNIPKTTLPLKVKIENKNLCRRYTAIVINNLKVGESPNFIKERLTSCGVRPINNIVDITNYIMLELGQPLHAFDYERIKDQTILIRLAKKGESLVTLDGIKRNLSQNNLVIADSKKPIALAGIMGGQDSQVSSTTKTIVLESANFDPIITRKTSKEHNLRTEAATRFEKNLDLSLTKPALIKAVNLLQKYAAGKVGSNIIDLSSKKISPAEIITTFDFINSLLGIKLNPEEIISFLNRLQIKTVVKGNKFIVKPPTYRPDLKLPADIAEEVARIYGYDNIPTTLPKGEIKPPPINNSLFWEKEVKLFLRGLGFIEVNLSSFISKDLIKLIGEDTNHYLKLLNPMSPEKTYLRKSLISGLLNSVKQNLRYFDKFSLFEIGRIFIPNQKDKLPKEEKVLGGVVVGKSFLEVKGILEALFELMNLPFPEVIGTTSKIFKTNQAGKIGDYGNFGSLNLNLKNFLQTDKEVIIFELKFDKLAEQAKKIHFYKPIPLYPAIIEDYSFIFPRSQQIGPVLSEIKKLNLLINRVEVIDKYEQTYTFRIMFQDSKKQLSSREIAPIREKLVFTLKEKFNAQFKGKI